MGREIGSKFKIGERDRERASQTFRRYTNRIYATDYKLSNSNIVFARVLESRIRNGGSLGAIYGRRNGCNYKIEPFRCGHSNNKRAVKFSNVELTLSPLETFRSMHA